jgi:FixJ family two-component response regulator
VSGLEALKLYRFTASKPIPVIILSANVTTEAIGECQRAGAAEFVAKPVRASLLLDAIERNLAEEEQLTSAPPSRSEERHRSPSLRQHHWIQWSWANWQIFRLTRRLWYA